MWFKKQTHVMMKLQEIIFGAFGTLIVIAFAIFTHVRICFQELLPHVIIVLATTQLCLPPTLVEL